MREGKGRTTQFAVVPEWVIFGASANGVKVYAVLDRHRNARTGQCNPSLKTLAELMDVSQDTARRALRELEGMGAIMRVQGFRSDGGKTTNEYRLTRDPELRDLLAAPGTDARRAPGTDARTKNETKFERDSLDLAPLDLETSGTEIESYSRPPKLKKIDGRNIAFDALCEVCGVNPDGNQAGRVSVALNGSKAIKVGIRQLAWREIGDIALPDPQAESFERYVASRIREQAALYRSTMPHAQLTPTALATWWTDLHGAVKATSYNVFDHLKAIREGGT